MSHWKKLFKSQVLNVGDFENPELDFVVEIKNVVEDFKFRGKSGEESSPAMFVCECEKPILLNVTVSKQISKALNTPNYNEWIGRKISIYIEFGKRYFGELHDVVRVRTSSIESEIIKCKSLLNACSDLRELKACWDNTPIHISRTLMLLKNDLKTKLQNENTSSKTA